MIKQKISVPEGYEIDLEKSDLATAEVVFKEIEKKRVLKWEDIKELDGYWIESNSELLESQRRKNCDKHKNIFATKQYAEAALAFAQLSQVYQYYEHKSLLEGNGCYAVIPSKNGKEIKLSVVKFFQFDWHFLFPTEDEAQLFLDNNRDLLEKFHMLK